MPKPKPKKLTSDQALELEEIFSNLSTALGNERRARKKAKNITKHQNQELLDAEWDLLGHAQNMTTLAVGLALDESTISFEKLQKSTTKAKNAVKTLNDIRKVIMVATATVSLAISVMSKDPGGVAKNAQALFKAATAEA